MTDGIGGTDGTLNPPEEPHFVRAACHHDWGLVATWGDVSHKLVGATLKCKKCEGQVIMKTSEFRQRKDDVHK